MTVEEPTNIKLFRIDNPQECRIIERLNRFVVNIELKGNNHPAYINNTGRLHELLVKGKKAFCFRTQNTDKTDFRLFAIEESGLGALIDTQLFHHLLFCIFSGTPLLHESPAKFCKLFRMEIVMEKIPVKRQAHFTHPPIF